MKKQQAVSYHGVLGYLPFLMVKSNENLFKLKHGYLVLLFFFLFGLLIHTGCGGGDSEDTAPIIATESYIHDTGQNQCFDNAAEITCPDANGDFYGQDALYSSNPLKFVDGGSVVTDNINGLMWQKADDGVKYNWYQAIGIFDATYNPDSTNVCGSLNQGGYSDWRLPSRRELVSLLNYNQLGADSEYFQSSGGLFWSSTTSPIVNSDIAWGIDDGGSVGGRVTYGFGFKGDSALFVRCVRGASWGQNNYIDNGNGSVTDTMSGLTWQQFDDGVARNWKEALAYCENLSLAGFSDWRLPDIKELESIVTINFSDETFEMPSIDTTYFPVIQNGDYWSSTSHSIPKYAWGVDFAFGWVDYGHMEKENFKFCKCVR